MKQNSIAKVCATYTDKEMREFLNLWIYYTVVRMVNSYCNDIYCRYEFDYMHALFDACKDTGVSTGDAVAMLAMHESKRSDPWIGAYCILADAYDGDCESYLENTCKHYNYNPVQVLKSLYVPEYNSELLAPKDELPRPPVFITVRL